jgi:hypothetical protein
VTRRDTIEHQVAQIAIGDALKDALGDIWGDVMSATNPDATAGRWAATATPLVDATRAKSTALAHDYLEAVGPDDMPILDAPKAAREQIAKQQAFTGVYSLKQNIRRGMDPDEAMRIANSFSSGAMERIALNGGRETIRLTVNGLTYTAGWRRITDGNPCDFCAMLAGRGAVYRDAKAAGLIFKFHNHCGCTVEPFFFEDRVPGRAPRVKAPRRNAPTAR